MILINKNEMRYSIMSMYIAGLCEVYAQGQLLYGSLNALTLPGREKTTYTAHKTHHIISLLVTVCKTLRSNLVWL